MTYICDPRHVDVSRLEGLFVGQLAPDELAAFELAIEAGTHRRSYRGCAGLMGLAVVVKTSTPHLVIPRRKGGE